MKISLNILELILRTITEDVPKKIIVGIKRRIFFNATEICVTVATLMTRSRAKS